MCISLTDESASAEEIANLWKNVTATSPEVEQHRLKCALPANVTTAIINNVDQGKTIFCSSIQLNINCLI